MTPGHRYRAAVASVAKDNVAASWREVEFVVRTEQNDRIPNQTERETEQVEETPSQPTENPIQPTEIPVQPTQAAEPTEEKNIEKADQVQIEGLTEGSLVGTNLTVQWNWPGNAESFIFAMKDLTSEEKIVPDQKIYESIFQCPTLTPGHSYQIAVASIPYGWDGQAQTASWRVLKVNAENEQALQERVNQSKLNSYEEERRQRAVTQAEKWYGTIWTLEKDMVLWNGTVAPKGSKVRGIPYSCANNHVGMTIDTYFDLSKETMYTPLNKGGYGADCTQLVFDCWKATNSSIQRDNMLKDHGKQIRWNEIKKGDILRRHNFQGRGDHIAIIVDVLESGEYEVINNTTWNGFGKKLGEENNDGTIMIGTCKAVWTKSWAERNGYIPYTCIDFFE